MKVVGIKVLKDNLSKYLRMVREGETVLVMDRDEVVAELHQPTRPRLSRVSPWEAFLNDEARAGSLRKASARAVPSLDSLAALPRPRRPIDLLRFECTAALRRAAILQDLQPGGDWASERLAKVELFFEGITFKALDASVEAVLRGNPELAVCTLDRRLREAALGQGFPVLPEAIRS